MGELADLPNIGKIVESQLNAVGITTAGDLRSAGSRQAWLLIRSIDESACIHRLYGLEGAIRNIPKRDLPPEIKDELKLFYREISGLPDLRQQSAPTGDE
ncbi:MAG: TfoX/Sxy family protein [Methanocalculaceae archaeon]|jgi:DNA transformation protein|nr:TfoX/Sxy family protein [Methanocalculaceae archaeon]